MAGNRDLAVTLSHADDATLIDYCAAVRARGLPDEAMDALIKSMRSIGDRSEQFSCRYWRTLNMPCPHQDCEAA